MQIKDKYLWQYEVGQGESNVMESVTSMKNEEVSQKSTY